MNIWLTTDTHFGHSMLVDEGLRPPNFQQRIFDGLHRNAQKGDLLIHLGDVGFNTPTPLIDEWNSIPSKKILCRGNHDHQSLGWYLEHMFDAVVDSFTLNRFGITWLFSHIPTPNTPNTNIHGHFHDGGTE